MTSASVHPKDRLLATASRLFYAEGIHAVGVERLVSEASVTRATFYRHYPTKDDLVAAYLTETSHRIREAVDAARAGKPPREALAAALSVVGDATCGEDFRGCQFLNAAAEYPDPESQVRKVIDDHRQWFFEVLRAEAAALGHPEPSHAARVLVLLRDGALHGGELDDAETVRATLRRAVEEFFPA
ncbi:TetR/AcrR family transcriptional regulator [Amycolatopsis sp. SID8362]|uniref:TetR/AcrR family transcriptional regulator n=1 Tax=Amycolatopsis sp. SID8362 TaxID=2690346 RepID=UPI001371D0F5|nr:TetR/AcrR family transcriptional regulator [Amycolatopsis sp. SID8362]NBH05012.1 TetR family transcriptional regulator [Amycolatopsis sp. SID8362]NED41712.1 TetR/AcrR family transcriptional regulator [Amycolatopsis sp. SID8362]